MILNVLIHSTILLTVSTFLFFSNEAVQKTQVLNQQIDELIDGDRVYSQNSNNDTHNRCLYEWSMGVCLLLGAMTIIYMYIHRRDIDFGKVLQENVVVFVIIFLFEYLFFSGFASRYRARQLSVN